MDISGRIEKVGWGGVGWLKDWRLGRHRADGGRRQTPHLESQEVLYNVREWKPQGGCWSLVGQCGSWVWVTWKKVRCAVGHYLRPDRIPACNLVIQFWMDGVRT